MLFLWLIQHGHRIFLKAVDRIIAAGTRIYRTRWSFFVAWSRRCRACGTVRMNQPSEGERAEQRKIDRETETDREKRNKGKRKRRGGGWETNARKKKRRRDRNETVGPRVGCSPNSSTCPRDASNNIVLISRHRRGSRAPNF